MGITVGIVGVEAKKLTGEWSIAQAWIRDIIDPTRGNWESGNMFGFPMDHPKIDLVVSGGCHLGGIDILAKEECEKKGVPFKEFLPKKYQWTGGYKDRNLEIVNASDIVVCLTRREYPLEYDGLRFPYCYHCKRADYHRGWDHVKSGGCWTVHQALARGKYGGIWLL